jgi:deoxyribose-phosphate aldolase
MDQSQLVEKIVSEILQRLARAGGAPGASPGGDMTSGQGQAEAPSPPRLSPAEVAKYIDHTVLKPMAATTAYDTLCREALTHRFFGVCVNSSWVAYVARKLQGSGIHVCSVVGFPLGAMTPRAKAFETREAISAGAAEIDMVINVGLLKNGDYRDVEEDIRAVRRATRPNTILKVIIETVFLTHEEKIVACELSKKAGADFVKTCTGFMGGVATVEDVALMRRVVGPEMGVKASTGVKTYKEALSMIAAGATRLGTGSTSLAIVNGS